MNRPIFREVALERLSSPDELDRLLKVTDFKGWIAQLTIFALIVLALAWGYIGRIPSVVSGQGVIVRRGGVLNVVAAGSGVVAQLKVKVGDRISEGQIVATVAQPAILEKRKNVELALAQARRERDWSHALRVQQAKMETAAIQRQHDNAQLEAKHLEEQAALAAEIVAGQDQLFAAGIVIKQKAIEAKQNLAAVQDRIASVHAHLQELEAQEFSIRAKVQEEDAQKQLGIEELERNLSAVEKDLEIAGNVISPYRGEVLEVKVSAGATVAASDPVVSIQPDVQDLEVLLYLPAARAKDVRKGMEAMISPSSVKPEEYGFIKGYVSYVSDFPDTPAELMHNFQNEVLVKALTGEGPVTGLHVEMERNPKTLSGYQWSSSRGPNLTLSGGTLCTAEVVTRWQRPAELLLPALRKTFGLT
jgi:NHLM bacteriocin system secretion protein